MAFKPVQIHTGFRFVFLEHLSSDLAILYFDLGWAYLVDFLMVSFHAIRFQFQHKWVGILTLASMVQYPSLGILHRFPQVLLSCEPQGVVTISVGSCWDLLLERLGQEAYLGGFNGAATQAWFGGSAPVHAAFLD